MTMHPEHRFNCDRCKTEVILPMTNTPINSRFVPPGGWTTLRINEDPSRPLTHLCPDCTTEFLKLIMIEEIPK